MRTKITLDLTIEEYINLEKLIRNVKEEDIERVQNHKAHKEHFYYDSNDVAYETQKEYLEKKSNLSKKCHDIFEWRIEENGKAL